MSNLYADAIVDAAKLKELAFKNAQSAVIESITPKLKQMIDEQLLREDGEDVVKPRSDDDDDILLDLAADTASAEPSSGLDEPAGVTLPDEEGKVTLDLDDFVVSAPAPDGPDAQGPGTESSDDLFMSTESAQLLAALLGEEVAADDADNLQERIDGIVNDIKALGGAAKLSSTQIAENLRVVRHTYFRVRESVGLSDGTKTRLEEKLERLHETLKRAEKMTKSPRRIVENDIEITISGLPDSVEAEEVTASVAAADSDSDDEQGGLEDLEGNDDMADEVYEMDDMKEADELDELDEGDLEITVSGLPDDVEADEVSVDVAPADDMGDDLGADDMGGGDDLELSDDDVVEIPEAVLRQEIARIRKARQARLNEDGPGGAPGPSEFDDFGDASKEAELFTDYDDGDLNKNEARRRLNGRQSRMVERRMRRLATENKRLTRELSEANLFNAKMVYANKLLQRAGLSAKQKAHIVETLDRAQSVSQLKTVYRSIVESLARRSSKTMNESTAQRRVLGSSSKATSSSAPKREVLQEGNETVARWEVLAGMKNLKETV